MTRGASPHRRPDRRGASAWGIGTLLLCRSIHAASGRSTWTPPTGPCSSPRSRRDPELPTDVGYALAGLVELGVEEVFVRALVRRLRDAPAGFAPALAVLPAADEALVEAGWPL